MDGLDPHTAFSDCVEFFDRDQNGKSKIYGLPENLTICLYGSWIMASESPYDVYVAYPKLASESPKKWRWDYKNKISSPFAVLGEYNSETRSELEPISKIVCKSKYCKIQLLEVSIPYEDTIIEVVDNVKIETKIVHRSYITTIPKGNSTHSIHNSKKKINDSYYKMRIENCSELFAFPEQRTMSYKRDDGISIWDSHTKEDIDEKLNIGVLGTPKTNEYKFRVSNSYNPSTDDQGNYEYNLSWTLSWEKNERVSRDEEPTEFMFPDVFGELPMKPGIYFSSDFIPKVKKHKEFPGWLVALSILGVVMIIAVIIAILTHHLKKKRPYHVVDIT